MPARLQAYNLVPTDFDNLAHHAPLHLAYMKELLLVEETFGSAIPDNAFVVGVAEGRGGGPVGARKCVRAPGKPAGHRKDAISS